MYNNNNRRNNGYNNNRDNRDYEPKKDWRRRTTHQANGLPKNLRAELEVSCYGMTLDGKDYDGTSFIDLMEDLQSHDTFSKISIPIYIRIPMADKPGKFKHIVVGFLKEFNTETGMAICTIYARSTKLYGEVEDPIILPRVAIKDGKCSCIIGLDAISRSEIKK